MKPFNKLPKDCFGLKVGIFEAERIKLLIGSALPFGELRSTSMFGSDFTTGMPKQVEITDEIVREALHEPITAIISSVMTALEQTSAEIAHDIISRGIYFSWRRSFT